MKQLTLLLLTLIISVFSAYSNNTIEPDVLKGTIGNYEIKMTLIPIRSTYEQAAGGYVTDYKGSYTYTKAGNTLKLSGTSIMGTLTLEETTPAGKKSGIFDLQADYEGNYNYIGTFTNLSNGKEYPVKLKYID